MAELDVKSIRKMALTTQIFNRGMSYYEKKRVGPVTTVTNEHKLKISASVWGQQGQYDCDAQLSHSDLDSCHCGCKRFNKKDPPCEHIIALLLKYYFDYSTKNYYQRQQTIETIKLFETLKLMNENKYQEKNLLDVEYSFEVSSCSENAVCGMTMKIGVAKKLYVVKDLYELLDIYFSREGQIEFGKGFSFMPSLYDFTSIDQEVLKILYDNKILKEASMNWSEKIQWLNRKSDKKSILLTSSQLHKIFTLLQNQTVSLKIDSIQHKLIPIFTEDMPLSFELIKEAKNIVLIQKQNEIPLPLLNDQNSPYFYQGAIYLISSEQAAHYYPLYKQFRLLKRNFIELPLGVETEVGQYILPTLKKISNNVTIQEPLKDSFYAAPLHAKYYIDIQNDEIVGRVFFEYGIVELNPLLDLIQNTTLEGQILLREIEKEKMLLNKIESLGFIERDGSYVLQWEEMMIHFLVEGVESLQQHYEIYLSESFRKLKVYKKSSFRTSVAIQQNYLEFSFSAEEIERKEIVEVLKAIRQKKKYYRLKKGGFVDLQCDDLRQVSDIVHYLGLKEKDLLQETITLSQYHALYLDAAFKQFKDVEVRRNKKYKELISTLTEMKDNEYKLPKNLELILRPYQKTGFTWYKTLSEYGFGGILADEMGLGKTLQTLAFIQDEIKENNQPCLVVAPSSLIYNWQYEIEKFSPTLKSVVIQGSKKERENLLSTVMEQDIVITSYPLLRRDLECYQQYEFSYLFLDEAQNIKNPQSVNAQSVKEIRSARRFALTGTPIENSLLELWSIFDFIMPGYLLSRTQFTSTFETPITKDSSVEALNALRQKISPFILRRTKKEVLSELPPKIEHQWLVEMKEEQKKIYLAHLELAKKDVNETLQNEGFNKGKIKILALLMKLRQICCDPSTVYDEYCEEHGKLEALKEILEESIDGGHKILLFSQFTSVLKNILKYVKQWGYEALYLDGETRVADRMNLVQQFNDSKIPLFLISLKAGGTGLNLTSADIVIHFDPWWNPAVEEQAADRAHRLGQTQSVEVIKLITKGTIEEKICKLQQAKKEIIEKVIVEGETFIHKLSEQEIKNIFSL